MYRIFIIMSGQRDIVKKGKDCVAIAKNALDDLVSGREEMALNKLSALKTDGSFLADVAKQQAERLEAEDKHYQQKDAEILREIGDLSRRENELKSQKSGEESQLAAHQSVLQDNQNRLSSEENRLRDAERKLRKAKEDEKKRQIMSTAGGAVLGLFTGGVGFVVGAAAGAGIGAIINECRSEEKDARDAVNRRRNDVDNAQSAINASRSRISNTESQIRSLTAQIEHMKQQRLQSHKKVDEVRALIELVKQSIQFWLLFKQISENGVDRTALLQKIVSKAVEKGDYRVIQSKSSQHIASTFFEAWEEMAMECERSNKIEYSCSQFSVQGTALP